MGQKSKQTPSGFTLIEVLVISPIVILFIGSFISLIVALTGDSLVLHTKNVASYDVQAALNTMEASINQSTAFLTDTTGVVSPQGRNNSSSQFTHTPAGEPETLILSSPATDRRPADPARSIIYTGTGACNSANPLYTFTTVFFVDTATNILYKRTILPQISACASPWQRPSCAESLVAANPTVCKVSDEKLLDGVNGIYIDYFSAASDSTPLADSAAADAATAAITISLATQAAGSQINYSGSVRATSLNTQTADTQQPPPSNPDIQFSRDANTPYLTTFTWDTVGNATGFNIRYRLNGGTWVDGPQNTTQTSFEITASARKHNADIEVTVVTSSGSYLYGTKYTNVPDWNSCTPAGLWGDYTTSWPSPSFTRTSANVVVLRGLIAGGTVAAPGSPTEVCTLPAGFRPDKRLIFQASTAGSTAVRVDILPTGQVWAYSPSSTWLNLASITFLSNGTGSSSKGLTGMGTPLWQNYGGTTFSDVKVIKTHWAAVIYKGLRKSGTMTAYQNAFGDFTGGYGFTSGENLFPAMNTGETPKSMQLTGNHVNTRTGMAGNTYWSLQGLFYPTGSATWQTFTPLSGWLNWGAPYAVAGYAKSSDNIVSLQGLIKSGTTTSGTIIYTLPVGYRPNYNVMCDVITSPDTYARIDVNPSGQIVIREAVSSTYLSLSGM